MIHNMLKYCVLLMARWASQVVQDGQGAVEQSSVEDGNPQYLVSSLLLFYISFCIS